MIQLVKYRLVFSKYNKAVEKLSKVVFHYEKVALTNKKT